MSLPLPTKMSQFENVTSLSTASYIIGLDVYGGALSNIKISGSAAGYELARKRWIIDPPVTSTSDSRGDDGAESYSDDGKYWIKSGSVWIEISGGGGAGGTAGSSGTSGQNGQNGSSGTSGQTGQNGSSGTSGQSGQTGPTTGAIYSRLMKNISGTISNYSSETKWANADVFNVKDFGAVGDGATNDTSAILSAISACQAAGRGTVYFPSGIYYINSALTIPANPQCDIAVVGDGSNVSIIMQNANSANGISFNMDNGTTDDQAYQVSIRGIGFQVAGSITAGNAIDITYGTSNVSAHTNVSVDIFDVHVLCGNTNYWAKGIVLETAWNFRISNSMVCGRTLGSGYQGTGLEIKRRCINGTITQCQFNFWDTGIKFDTVDYTATGENDEGILINQVYMVPVTHGIKVLGNAAYTLGNPSLVDWQGRYVAGRITLVNILNSHIDSRGSGIPVFFQNAANYTISNNFFINGESANACIAGENAYEGTVVANMIFNPNNSSVGSVHLTGYSTYSSSANIISSNIFRGGITHVKLNNASVYNKVYGNALYDGAGITVSDTGTSNLVGSVGN